MVVMHTRHGLKIADRIHLLLVREIGQGLDRQRMVNEPLYARDVLLVCDALHGTDGPLLAGHFRRAATNADQTEQASRPKGRGFGMSGWLASLFGPHSGFGEQPAQERQASDRQSVR